MKKAFYLLHAPLFIVFLVACSQSAAIAQNVGIGTTTPADKLTVETENNSYGITHRSVQGNILSTRIGGSTAGIGTFSPTDMRIFSGGLSRMFISQANGEVFNSTDDITVGNKLTVRTANNSYGITHLGDNGNVLSSRIGGTTAGFGTFSPTDMRIFSGGLSRMFISQSTGEVSIGTDDITPGNKLFVRTAGGSYGITHSDGNIVLSSYLGGSLPYAYIGTQSNHALGFYTNNSAAQMTLSTEGNIGIGTAPTPGVRMHINQGVEALRLTGNQPYMTFFNGVNYKGYVRSAGADDMEMGTGAVNTNGKLHLSIQGTPRLSVSNTGQVAVHGVPAPYLSPAFTVNGIFTMARTSEWTLEASTCGATGSGAGPCLTFSGNGFFRARIDANGDWITASERSLKDEIQEYKPVLEGIKKLQVSSYKYKYNDPSVKSFGLIAQNVAEFFPEVVSSFEGKSGEPLMGISYGKMSVLAIKAIQEQQQIIEQQQQRIEKLEEKLMQVEKWFLELKK